MRLLLKSYKFRISNNVRAFRRSAIVSTSHCRFFTAAALKRKSALQDTQINHESPIESVEPIPQAESDIANSDQTKPAWWRKYILPWSQVKQELSLTIGNNVNNVNNNNIKNHNSCDILILYAPKFAPNIGMLLRHLPILSPNSMMIIVPESKSKSQKISDSIYTQTFLKTCLRVSMAYTREQFCARLCLCEEGMDEIFETVSESHKIIAFENKEIFTAMEMTTQNESSESIESTFQSGQPGSSSNVQSDIDLADANLANSNNPQQSPLRISPKRLPLPVYPLYSCPLLSDISQPLIMVFGGESDGIPLEVLKKCDAGCYIPSQCDEYVEPYVENDDKLIQSNIYDLESEEISEFQSESDSKFVKIFKAHTCNLSVAATIALGERFRWKWTTKAQMPP